MVKYQTKDQSALGFWLPLVRVVLVVAKDVVHHGRFPADLGHDHVAVDGLGDVGGLVIYRVADLLDRDALLLVIDTAVCRPSWVCQRRAQSGCSWC